LIQGENIMKKITILTLAAFSLSLGASADAQTVLKISSWAPPTHHVNSVIWPAWGKWLDTATQGRVKTKIEYKLASPLKQFSLVRDGVADAAWIFHGYNTRYVATQVVEMPNLGTSAEAASLAYWKVHEKYLHKAREHRGVKLIGLMSHGPAVIQTKKPITQLSSLKGMKIRVPGGVGSLVGKTLGVTAVKLPAPKVYEALSSGVADGIFMPVETQKSFRLKEVVRHVTVMPGGLYYGSFGLIMSEHAFNKLSATDQDFVNAVSGEKLSQFAGIQWDAGDSAGLAAARAAGTKFTDASSAMKAQYLKMMQPVEAAWVKKVAKHGIDGNAALAELRTIARDYDKGRK
jgi:TRAP-type C4-dicarboxylate transport system substrate-binding protein